MVRMDTKDSHMYDLVCMSSVERNVGTKVEWRCEGICYPSKHCFNNGHLKMQYTIKQDHYFLICIKCTMQ